MSEKHNTKTITVREYDAGAGYVVDNRSRGGYVNAEGIETGDCTVFPTQAAAQAALDEYLQKGDKMQVICSRASKCDGIDCWHKKPHDRRNSCDYDSCPHGKRSCVPVQKGGQAKAGAEVAPDKLVVGQRVRIEVAETRQRNIAYCPNGVHTIGKLVKLHWNDEGAFTSLESPGTNYTQKRYNFYTVGSQEPEKEQDKMGQTLFTTAVAEIVEDKDGNKTIKAVTDERTEDAERINQAMIARHTASVLACEDLEKIPHIVGKNDNGEWIRMDEI